MYSESKIVLMLFLALFVSCSQYRALEKIRDGQVSLNLAIAQEQVEDTVTESVIIDSIRSSLTDEPLIMKAIKDTETGEMVATDVIRASRVVAKFRNVAERAGYVTVSFDICVPSEMSSSEWQLKVFPFMAIQKDTVALEPVFITGEKYRGRQMRGYEKYQEFLSSIITDPNDFLRMGQLEIFLQRHFPETYAMKSDTSFIAEPMAENLFGVTQRDAFEHYRKDLKWRSNERRKGRVEEMYDKYVKDPILSEGIRLDTVLLSSDGDFIYRYNHVFRSRPMLRKVNVSLEGKMYRDGECFMHLPFPEELTFYISSLSSLTDDRLRYVMHVRQRTVYENTKALIDFAHASSEVDTLLGDNASELARVRQCVEDVYARKEFILDSLVVVASCSPEGSYNLNSRLSADRSRAVKDYISDFVPAEWKDSLKTSVMPENWDQLMRLVENDTVLSPEVRKDIVVKARRMDGGPDVLEEKLSLMPEYGYLRESLYPKLRSVSFDFHLHRADMVQDTVYTTDLDTVYMDGVQAIRDLDYRKAVTILRPYDDYNSALAFMCADYNHSAMDVLARLDDTDPRVCYLKAMVLSRLEQVDEAVKYFELALAYDPRLEYRANLDPEMYEIVKQRQSKEL
jgi:tetratricopeptide (TPR) repeat protein